jgi:hypothetical protein
MACSQQSWLWSIICVMKRKTPDFVCADALDNIKFKVALLPEDPTYVLIEGDKDAFKFLARLLDAQADAGDCGFQIGPKCAGRARFKKGSSLGLYLHRLPCVADLSRKVRRNVTHNVNA